MTDADRPRHAVATAEELGDLVRAARSRGECVVPGGGGTQRFRGGPVSKPGPVLDLRRLSRVVDYPARDLTITVEAGLTVAELARTLARERQRLPIDIPDAERATVGGSIAANVSGPRRLAAGTFRDYVLGMRFVTDDGKLAQGGGRVVKNVAGYDLMKLQVGALGTLGILTEVTLKVTPAPEAQAVVVAKLTAEGVAPALDAAARFRCRPVVVELWNRVAAAGLCTQVGAKPLTTWALVLGFEDKATTVKWQVATALEELRGTPAHAVPEAARWFEALTEWPHHAAAGQFAWRAATLPSRVAATALAWDALGGAVHAHALTGVVQAYAPLPVTPEATAALWAATRVEAPGRRTLERGPAGLTDGGPPHSDEALMRLVKRQLDPDGVFSPGRMLA